MRSYAPDSPEAIARVLAMTMIADAKLDDRELELMDRLSLYDVLGLGRTAFSEVVQDFCDDLLAAGGRPGGKVDLMDRDRIDAVLAEVVDPAKRRLAAQMVVNVAKADGTLHDNELALFRQVLARWGLTLDGLK
ncbi:MAG: TerB family tellurite resistance protein [Burkholderiales bacterium]|jgi:uncharacterized tellurite resistance protein B-like protein|nr:TerB family tellurite resistance protein [Burkholderiales bacterium]